MVPFLLPIPPRLLLMGFNFAQPFFLYETIRVVEENPGDLSTKNYGYGLIGATALIFIGFAVGRTLQAGFPRLIVFIGGNWKLQLQEISCGYHAERWAHRLDIRKTVKYTIGCREGVSTLDPDERGC